MPEIAEAARIVHFLKANLVGKKIKTAKAIEDASVFGKVGTTGAEVAKSLKGKKVVGAGSQGKYFWLVLDTPPHPVMHFGMTGWMHIKGLRTGYTNYYNKLKAEEIDMWPPKYWKFQLETDSSPKMEVAFTDPRRFGRVRLVDCPGESIRKYSPLVENGPDPVVDANTTFTEDYFLGTLHRRHVPIKALLLDQSFISGIGNWVGDEVLFHARLHPEQYCDEFSDAQMKRLYESIRFVCSTAVDLLGDSDQFPEDWLFCHRWGKGNKSEVAQLPNGEKLAFVTVGGRTSCYAPGLQKNTGNVAPGIKEEQITIKPEKISKTASKKRKSDVDPAIAMPRRASKTARTAKSAKEAAEPAIPAEPASKTPRQVQKRKHSKVKEETSGDVEHEMLPSVEKKRGKAPAAANIKPSTATIQNIKPTTSTFTGKAAADTGRRRSARLSMG